MKVVVHGIGIEIECPDKPHLMSLVLGMNPHQSRYLHNRQKEPKNFPNHTNIPEYCIYMGSERGFEGTGGSMEDVDFYHYEPADGLEYSTGIVNGDAPGDYRSGWQGLAAKRGMYREHMHREFMCGFLTADDLIKVGMAALRVEKESWNSIRPMRATFKLGVDSIHE